MPLSGIGLLINGLEEPDSPGYVPFARVSPVAASKVLFAKGDEVGGLNWATALGLSIELRERRGEVGNVLRSMGVAFALGRLDGS